MNNRSFIRERWRGRKKKTNNKLKMRFFVAEKLYCDVLGFICLMYFVCVVVVCVVIMNSAANRQRCEVKKIRELVLQQYASAKIHTKQ